ncbi:LysE family translocator [Thalassovita sp.]|jgi:threonine/homoserine/homoserine lactone efflux protein|uniref:LysE family translocator n=1 Tax=Thalassovita sp. TaxID=1979401 RepID=UPI003B5BE2B9
MTYSLLTALAAFAFVSSITPGPNNLMLMTSGANYGFLRSVPHMLGVAVGFTVMIVIVGLGLMQLFERFPLAHQVLTWVSVAYLLWLSWKIATAKMPDTRAHSGRPMSFLQAALFQWVNPKAWQMALTAITLYAPDRSGLAVGIVALVFGLINLPCVSSWVVLGQKMQRVLSSNARLMAFNWTMALLLVATLFSVL